MSELPSEGFIRIKQVLKVIPVSKSTWWAGVASGRFPEPVKLGPRVTAWRVEDIRKLIGTPLPPYVARSAPTKKTGKGRAY